MPVLVQAPTLSQDHLMGVLFLVAILLLVAGIVIVIFRYVLERPLRSTNEANDDPPDLTLIRSWVAVALVSALVLFAAGSLFIDNGDLQNLLMGGVISAASTAVAFYFASKASIASQRLLLTAALGTPLGARVPDVKGMTFANATATLAAKGLDTVKIPNAAADDDKVSATMPAQGVLVKPGDKIALIA